MNVKPGFLGSSGRRDLHLVPNRQRGSLRTSKTAGITRRWLENDGHMENTG